MTILPASAYSPGAWSTFFSAEAGASAALTGLLFVAVSINLNRILQFPHLVAWSAKALVTLGLVLLVSTLCLTPGQSARLLGAELVVFSAGAWIAVHRLFLATRNGNRHLSGAQLIVEVFIVQGTTLSVLAAGASLWLGRGGGLFWLLATVLFAFAGALIDAWVLLIEIQR